MQKNMLMEYPRTNNSRLPNQHGHRGILYTSAILKPLLDHRLQIEKVPQQSVVVRRYKLSGLVLDHLYQHK